MYLNRRGYAPTLFCPACGWVAPCPRCDARLTRAPARAGGCTATTAAASSASPRAVPDLRRAGCSPWARAPSASRRRSRELFPDEPLERIDRDAVRRRGELEAASTGCAAGGAAAGGHADAHQGPPLPGRRAWWWCSNADQGLFGTDFRASERLAQTIVQVAGRAGRAERPGEVLIQTEYPEHPLLAQLITGGYDAFATAALEERRQARWPPFARIAVLRAEAARRERRSRSSTARGTWRRSLAPRRGSRCSGPPPHRWSGAPACTARSCCCTRRRTRRCSGCWRAGMPAVEELPEARRVRWSLDVDPLELF